MLGVKSGAVTVKGKFADEFLSEVIRMTKRNHKKKKTAKQPKLESGYVFNWR